MTDQRDTPDPGKFFGALAPTRTLSNADTPDTDAEPRRCENPYPHPAHAKAQWEPRRLFSCPGVPGLALVRERPPR